MSTPRNVASDPPSHTARRSTAREFFRERNIRPRAEGVCAAQRRVRPPLAVTTTLPRRTAERLAGPHNVASDPPPPRCNNTSASCRPTETPRALRRARCGAVRVFRRSSRRTRRGARRSTRRRPARRRRSARTGRRGSRSSGSATCAAGCWPAARPFLRSGSFSGTNPYTTRHRFRCSAGCSAVTRRSAPSRSPSHGGQLLRRGYAAPFLIRRVISIGAPSRSPSSGGAPARTRARTRSSRASVASATTRRGTRRRTACRRVASWCAPHALSGEWQPSRTCARAVAAPLSGEWRRLFGEWQPS